MRWYVIKALPHQTGVNETLSVPSDTRKMLLGWPWFRLTASQAIIAVTPRCALEVLRRSSATSCRPGRGQTSYKAAQLCRLLGGGN